MIPHPAEARRVWVLVRDVADGDWSASTVVARAETVRQAVAREQAVA